MVISERGLNLIKSFEGCRLTAYKCPAGVWTIGWGHTGDVVAGQTITQEQADRMLRVDMAAYEAKVMKYNDAYKWNQNEFDALTSFAYNVGSIDQLTANGTRSRDVIADKLLAYNKGGGKVLTGLVRRRKAEQELFLEAVKSITVEKKSGWYDESDGRKFYNGDTGEAVRNDWHKEPDGRWYWFDGSGRMVTDTWYRYKGDWYYLGADGAMVKGLLNDAGKWYYLDKTGAMATEPVMLTPDDDGALQFPGLT